MPPVSVGRAFSTSLGSTEAEVGSRSATVRAVGRVQREQPVDQFLLPAGNGQALLAQPLFELGHVEHRKVLVHALWSSRGFIKAVVPCVAGRRLCSAQISSPVHRCPRRCSMLS